MVDAIVTMVMAAVHDKIIMVAAAGIRVVAMKRMQMDLETTIVLLTVDVLKMGKGNLHPAVPVRRLKEVITGAGHQRLNSETLPIVRNAAVQTWSSGHLGDGSLARSRDRSVSQIRPSIRATASNDLRRLRLAEEVTDLRHLPLVEAADLQEGRRCHHQVVVEEAGIEVAEEDKADKEADIKKVTTK
jgi:hypothetical protein